MSVQAAYEDDPALLSTTSRTSDGLPNAVADETSGALLYEYELDYPPGRNGLMPESNLVYDSRAYAKNGVLGMGWSMDIPVITRLNKHGIEDMYAENYFTSSLSGELLEEIPGTFVAREEFGSFLRYTLSGNVWTVVDKTGLTYTFGATVESRTVDPADANRIAEWHLTEVRDANDNYVKFVYVKDQNQVYPSSIVYTGNGSTDGVFQVSFLTESRADAETSYGYGFPVTLAKRISQIDVSVDSSLVRRYALAYGVLGIGARSVLTGVTESGFDALAVETALPEVTFEYQDEAGTMLEDQTWTADGWYTWYTGAAFDANGDALADAFRAQHVVPNSGPNYSIRNTYLNDGNKNLAESLVDYIAPLNFGGEGWIINSDAIYGWLAPLDVNGDGLIDVVSATTDGGSFINDGDGNWNAATSWNLPFRINSSPYPQNKDLAGYFGDLNGDGLTDFFRAMEIDPATPEINNPQVYLNTGSGWASDSGWAFPFPLKSEGLYTVDVNGDGLVDIIKGFYYLFDSTVLEDTKVTYINQGDGTFALDPSYAPPVYFLQHNTAPSWSSYEDKYVRFADVNGDGLVDLWSTGPQPSYLNTGSGWVQMNGWSTGCAFGSPSPSAMKTSCRIADMDGNGMPDLLQLYDYWTGSEDVPKAIVRWNTAPKHGLLQRITNEYGGISTISYKAAGEYRDEFGGIANPSLPFVTDTVNEITYDSGFGDKEVRTYEYEGGRYHFVDIDDRRFAGFHKVTATDADGNEVTTYFHQGDATDSSLGEFDDMIAKAGRAYRKEVRNASSDLVETTVTKWGSYDLGNGRTFVKKLRDVRMSYDVSGVLHRDVAAEYSYDDSNGNQLSLTEWGEVSADDTGAFTDVGTDKYVTMITYASDASSVIVGLKATETTVDQSASKESETRHYYDNQALGVLIKGNETKTEQWVTGTTYVDVQRTYDGTYGLVTAETDRRSKTTSYVYDAYDLYPATVTHPLAQSEGFTYDYSSGEVLQKNDVNGRVFETVYDGLDRPIERKQPDIAAPSSLVTATTYQYTDAVNATSVRESRYLDGVTVSDAYTYLDGFGRKLQERVEAESGFSVRDYTYDSRGMLKAQSTPYVSYGAARTVAVAGELPYTYFSYDALGRPSEVRDFVGVTATMYDRWTKSVTDANGHVKEYETDAYENLASVTEHEGVVQFVTAYEHDRGGRLTKLVDAAGNVRSFAYDGLGRRTYAEDLHVPSDVTYGTWAYEYDGEGNLTQRTDANGNVVDYGYDDLGRIVTEDYLGSAGIEVTYGYDSGTDGIGRVTSVSNAAMSKAFAYDALGNVVSETATVDAVPYTTTTSYDRRGNPVVITIPDGSQVKHVYNSAGTLEKLQRKETTDASFLDVVTDYDYAPTGQVERISYANGIEKYNVYDKYRQYRLVRSIVSDYVVPDISLYSTQLIYGASGDGYIDSGTSSTWQTLHDQQFGQGFDTYNGYEPTARLYNGTTYYIRRGFVPFDTSALPTGVDILDAVLSVYVESINVELNDGYDWLSVVETFQGDINSLHYSHFGSVGDVEGVDVGRRMVLEEEIVGKRFEFALNDVGKSWIDPDGSAFFGLRESHDLADVPPPYEGRNYARITNSSWTGTDRDPQLEVTYELPFTPVTDTLQEIRYTYDAVGNVTNVVREGVSVVDEVASQDSFFTASGDGYVYNDDNTWSTLRTAGAGVGVDDGQNSALVGAGKKNGGNYRMLRAFLPFDTSSLPDTAEITAAQLKVYVNATENADNDGDDWITVVEGLQPSGAALTTDDYDLAGSVNSPAEGISTSERKDISGISTGGYLTFTLDSTGEGWIDPTGTTKFALREGHDVLDAAYAGPGKKYNQIEIATSESGGTSNDPILEVSYTASAVVTPVPYTVDVTYTYDDLDRLTSATAVDEALQPLYTETYTYDAIGNILTGPAGTYAYDGDQGTSYANPHAVTSIGSTTYTYDANGNMLTKGSAMAYAWDYNNRLIETDDGSTVTSYGYDQGGQRVSLTTGSSFRHYPTGSYNTDGTEPVKHVQGNGENVATVTDTGTNAEVRYVHTDHLTGSSIVTDWTGAQDQLLDYLPFGGIRIDESSSGFDEQRKYAGHEFDGDTGLSYMGARYYDPEIGRFISVDPVFLAVGDSEVVLRKAQRWKDDYHMYPQATNSYSYVANNPLKHIDENGEFLHLVIGAGVGIIGQYASNVTTNITNHGLSFSSFTSNLSSVSEYALRGGQGALIAGTGGVVGAAGVGALGFGAATGTVAGMSSMAIDALQGRQVDVTGAAVDAVVTGLTAGLVDTVPKVPGRLPNFGTRAFMAGAHTQRNAIELGIDTATASAAVNVSEIFKSVYTPAYENKSSKDK